MHPGYVKVCGITSVADALHATSVGAQAIGLNLWPQSPRGRSMQQAVAIAAAVRGRVDVVAVMVHATPGTVTEVVRELAPDWLQLHGAPSEDCFAAAHGRAYAAVGLAAPDDVARALAAQGELVLIDAHDGERWGGTGHAAPLDLAARVCAGRPTLVAGGLTPENVANVIVRLRPYGVDAASGLEVRPGVKDPMKVERFVREARAAFGIEHV